MLYNKSINIHCDCKSYLSPPPHRKKPGLVNNQEISIAQFKFPAVMRVDIEVKPSIPVSFINLSSVWAKYDIFYKLSKCEKYGTTSTWYFAYIPLNHKQIENWGGGGGGLSQLHSNCVGFLNISPIWWNMSNKTIFTK